MIKIVFNPHRDPAAVPARWGEAPGRAFHQGIPAYAPTPLHPLPALARTLGLAQVWVKDESKRFGLNAFKGLGGSWAMGRYLCQKRGIPADERAFLRLKEGQEPPITFLTTTDGNHGRGVAWAARELGQKAVVHMPAGTVAERLENIRALGAQGKHLDIPRGILVHGGGWKKLAHEAVSPAEFRERIAAATGITRVSDYYGMAEQTGCIYLECPCGHLHASVWSDILVRRAEDGALCASGEPGVLQVLSLLPRSYPGHSLLTEDMGVLLGEDDCPCGRLGKYVRVTGRVPKAEVRGCSDTYAARF